MNECVFRKDLEYTRGAETRDKRSKMSKKLEYHPEDIVFAELYCLKHLENWNTVGVIGGNAGGVPFSHLNSIN